MTEEQRGAEREAQRLEAFSDGVLAVIITIMVLELKSPPGHGFKDLGDVVPGLLVYLLSFAFVGIYWNNHHHLLRATDRISGSVMWANLHLLFWLSLVPFVTSWMGRYDHDHLPASAYGVVALMAGFAYMVLTRRIIACNGPDSAVARGVGSAWKEVLSLIFYAAGVGGAWITPYIAYVLYALVSIMWFVPDRRLDRPSEAVDPV